MKSPPTLAWRVIVLCTVIAAGCTVVGPAVSSRPTPLAIRTQPSPGPNNACAMALGGGKLVADPVSGLGVADTTGQVTDVYWPFGYTARPDANRLALVDGQGRIVAHVGDVVSMTGGFGANNDWYACQFEPITLQAAESP